MNSGGISSTNIEDVFLRNILPYDWVPNAITYEFCYVVFDKYDEIY